MTVKRRTYVHRLRPLMFITAMIVPAILAVVMLMAKLAGYEDAARGSVSDGEKAAAQVRQPSGTATPETETPAGAPYVTVLPPTVTPPSGHGREHAEAEDGRDGAGRTSRGVTPQGDTARDEAAAPTPSPSPGPYGTADAASKDHRSTGRQNVASDRPASENGENPENAGKTATVENGNGDEPTGSRENTGDGSPASGEQTNDAGAAAAMAVDGTAGGAEPATSVRAGRDAVLEPTRVPEPLGPVRVYGGLIRIPEPEPGPQAPPAVVRRAPKPTTTVPIAPKEPSESAIVETPLTCSPEWRDTWLWELCREHTLALETSPGAAETSPRQGTVRHGKARERDVTVR